MSPLANNFDDSASIDYNPYDPESPYYDPNLVREYYDKSNKVNSSENTASSTNSTPTVNDPNSNPDPQDTVVSVKPRHFGKRAFLNNLSAKNNIVVPDGGFTPPSSSVDSKGSI